MNEIKKGQILVLKTEHAYSQVVIWASPFKPKYLVKFPYQEANSHFRLSDVYSYKTLPDRLMIYSTVFEDDTSTAKELRVIMENHYYIHEGDD